LPPKLIEFENRHREFRALHDWRQAVNWRGGLIYLRGSIGYFFERSLYLSHDFE